MIVALGVVLAIIIIIVATAVVLRYLADCWGSKRR